MTKKQTTTKYYVAVLLMVATPLFSVLFTSPLAYAGNDSDTINDTIDVDDDNDGILDELECREVWFDWTVVDATTGTGSTTGDAVITGVDALGQSVSVGGVPSNLRDPVAIVGNATIAGFPGTQGVSQEGSEVLGNEMLSVTQSSAATTYVFTFSSPTTAPLLMHLYSMDTTHGASGAGEIISIINGSGLGTTTFTFINDPLVTNDGGATLTLPIGTSVVSLSNTATGDNYHVSITSPCVDTDSDSVVDYLDLDSDNDGISDLLEARSGTSPFPTTGGMYTGGVDTTGLPLVLATTAVTPVDTDGDTVPDYLDLDSDDDGLPDAIEAQTAAGFVTPTHTGNGTNDGVNDTGLFTPLDSDSDGFPDYIDLDSDNERGNDEAESNGRLIPTYTNVTASTTIGMLKNNEVPATPEPDFREKDTKAPTITQDPIALLTEANKSSYPVTGKCTDSGDAITVTVTQGSGSATAATTCGADQKYSVLLDLSAFQIGSGMVLGVNSVISDGLNPQATSSASRGGELVQTGVAARYISLLFGSLLVMATFFLFSARTKRTIPSSVACSACRR